MRAFVGVASRRFGLLVLGGALFAEGVAFFVSPFFQKPKNYTRTITVLLLDQVMRLLWASGDAIQSSIA